MKKFIINEEQRNDAVTYIRARNYKGAIGILTQLEELKEEKKDDTTDN